MSSNRYVNFDYDQPMSSWVPLPLDMIYKVGAAKQAQQDAVELEKLDLLGKKWSMLPQDVENSKRIQSEVNKALEDFSGKDFTNPAVKTEWLKKKREISDRYSLTGDIGNIQANYDAYKAYEKNILDKSKELGWSQDQLQKHLQQTKSNFKGTLGEQGKFNYFTGEGLASREDTNKWLSETLKDVAADTGVEKLKRYGSLNAVTEAFRSGELEHKDAPKIINALSKRAIGDRRLMSSLEQEGLFEGQKGWGQFIAGETKEGDVVLNTKTPFGMALSGIAEGASYQKQKDTYMKVLDPYKLYQLKKRDEEDKVKQSMLWTLQGKPADPTDQGLTDAGMNTIIKNTDTALGEFWEFKDGKLNLSRKQGSTKSVVNIDGKEYDVNHLPEGYNLVSKPISRSKTGVESVPENLVAGHGKTLPIVSKPVTKDDLTNAYKAIIPIARRLGVTDNKPENIRKAVEDYYSTVNNFQMNFTTFDVGTKKALSDAFDAKTKIDKSGNLVIIDPGQLNFSTIKDINGKPINKENLPMFKAQLLTGASIMGPAQSLTNDNYKPGDLYINAVDPETGNPSVFIMNTNNVDFNMANAPASILTQSVNKYIQHGDIDSSPQLKKLNDKFAAGNQKFTSAIPDKEGNIYVSYVDYKNNKLNIGALKIDSKTGNPTPIGLDEASHILTKDYVKPLIPSYNLKNFDRATEADEIDIINQAISETE